MHGIFNFDSPLMPNATQKNIKNMNMREVTFWQHKQKA